MHCGKYPVLSLNMKGIGGDNWGEMLSRIWSCLRGTLKYQEENRNEQDVKFIGVDCYEATAQSNDLQKENLYHIINFGILVATYGPLKVKSNFEAGIGRCNIAIEFDEGKKVVLFEFKLFKTEKELANNAEMGLK